MPRHPSFVLAGAALIPLSAIVLALPAAASATATAQTYTWVGASGDPHADNHSWTDRRNWSPKGVPSDGDAVNIVSPQSGPCNIHVDQVPSGLTLGNLLLSTSITEGCRASISGGSITINGTLLWTGGTVDTPITVAAGSGALIGDEPVPVVERLLQPLVVSDSSLTLGSAHLRILDGGSLAMDPGSNLTVSHPSDVTGSACCAGPADLVNRGILQLFSSTLSLEAVVFDQRGEVDIDADSSIVTAHGSLLSGNGSRYVGPGRLIMSSGTKAVLTGSQDLRGGAHLELAGDTSAGSTLDGVATLTGSGSLDWTGGTIGAFLTLDTGVGLHAYGGHAAGNARRVLSGRDTRHASPQHQVISHGPVVVDGGAGFFMKHHAILSIAPEGSLSLAPGTHVKGFGLHQGDGTGDTIRASDTTVSVPADSGGAGPVVLDDLAYVLEGGQTDVAVGSELTLTGDVRGTLAQTGLTGGGTLSVAEPMDMVSLFSFEDGSLLRLMPGGSLDESAVYTGDGSFEWLGGEMSGNDVAFALNDLTIGGTGSKSIGDDHGSTSFVQVVNPVTFTPGSKASPSVLDMGGNAFESFVACTVGRNVELRDGTFASSDGALVFDAGAGGSTVTDRSVQLFSSGPLAVASGTLVSRGAMMVNAGDVDIRDGATLRLPLPSHPLMLQGGSLSGEGAVDGDIVNSAGVFDPLVGGADHPMAVRGSYVQSQGGRLVLDLSADSDPVSFGGAVDVAGTVTYNNLVGYAPAFGDERSPLIAGGALSWTPTCEETNGTRSTRGHWHGEADQSTLLATFVKGSGGSCVAPHT